MERLEGLYRKRRGRPAGPSPRPAGAVAAAGGGRYPLDPPT